MKLLIIEDETDLAEMLAKGLRKIGYAVDTAWDGEEGLYMFEVNEYDLIVLDLNLPKVDGLEVLRRIRDGGSAVKILILSARSSVEQRVDGLDRGADDYLIKPFDFSELAARINALLRQNMNKPSNELKCGSLTVDLMKKSVRVNGEEIQLTKKEYGMLEYLMRNTGAVISIEELIEHVWGSDATFFSNSPQFHIYSLKKKLGGRFIKNVRGHGYTVSEEE